MVRCSLPTPPCSHDGLFSFAHRYSTTPRPSGLADGACAGKCLPNVLCTRQGCDIPAMQTTPTSIGSQNQCWSNPLPRKGISLLHTWSMLNNPPTRGSHLISGRWVLEFISCDALWWGRGERLHFTGLRMLLIIELPPLYLIETEQVCSLDSNPGVDECCLSIAVGSGRHWLVEEIWGNEHASVEYSGV